MAIDVQQFELDRVRNMLMAFGWNVTSARFEGSTVIVQFKKTVERGGGDIGRSETERISQMLRSFGWTVIGTRSDTNEIIVDFKKDVVAVP